MFRLAAAALLAAALGCAAPGARRPFSPVADGRWIGLGLAYGPHRDGQRPGGATPTRAQLREDLGLLRGRWALLRVYGSDGATPELLSLVRDEGLPFRFLLGAWIAPEATPAARAANRAQVEGAVRLARAYPELVLAIVVGNETQVSWSDHRVPPDVLVGWIRAARRGAAVPVTTADDFSWWVLPESAAVARELDLVVAHVHPMWNGETLETALAFTRDRHADVVARHPGLPVVLGETGWATARSAGGEQARLIRGEPGEAPQRRFYEEIAAWATAARVPTTWFEAFDEAWKGGDDPADVEKHWGLFRADRTPKAAVAPPP